MLYFVAASAGVAVPEMMPAISNATAASPNAILLLVDIVVFFLSDAEFIL
jgi:hypothetical protein